MPEQISFTDATQPEQVEALLNRLRSRFRERASRHRGEDTAVTERLLASALTLPSFEALIGIPSAVHRQIRGAIASGKRHLLLYGPPGTGKTTLARMVAGALADDWKMVTASADWTSQDLIGGYMPKGGGQIGFLPGLILDHFDKPIVVDELNRCDIDKVIGPLFTVLSGQSTTLPYSCDPSDSASARYTLLPEANPEPAAHEFAPGPDWRLIATINTVDKASLYQMSYALSRRFAWIYVGVPDDLPAFFREWASRHPNDYMPPGDGDVVPLAELWSAVNAIRPIGPAPIIDLMRYARALCDESIPLGNPADGVPTQGEALADGFVVFVVPLLEGITDLDATALGDTARDALRLSRASESLVRNALDSVSL